MKWHKPRHATQNILVYFSILCGIVTVVTFVVFAILIKLPETTLAFESKLAPLHLYSQLTVINNKAKKSQDKLEQLKLYQELYDAVKDINCLSKIYEFKRPSATAIIDHHISNSNLDKAKLIAEDWESNNPYDFHAKFKYAEVLHHLGGNKDVDYSKALYLRHPRVRSVVLNYHKSLVRNLQAAEASKILKQLEEGTNE